MLLEALKNWTTEEVLAGRHELDWREGIHFRSWVASAALVQTVHGPMQDSGARTVHHGAQCFLCEYIYRPGDQRVPWEGLETVSYRLESMDIREVLHWSSVHKAAGSHVRAFDHFRKVMWPGS